MGCKSNQFEGSIIKENLVKNGFNEVDEIENADIYILNSCSVTHIAGFNHTGIFAVFNYTG
jgi:threonylcarbamoyladenosine tRNA methylthiotransferase MtaB